MKTSVPAVPRVRFILVSSLILGAAALPAVAASSPAPTAAPSGASASQPKDHTLYLGADFAVQWEGQPRPVQDVQGSSFVLTVSGNRVVVPSRMTDLQIKKEDILKIGVSFAAIANFKAERAYTPDRNPTRKLTESIAMSQRADAEADVALATLRASETRLGLEGASKTDAFNNPTPQALDPSALANESAAYQSSALAQGAGLNSISEGTVRATREIGEENYDAFYLSFDVSTPEPLTKPYAVVVTRYREKPDDPAARVWIYAQSLARVDAKPAKVRLFRGGFPPGYKLEEVEVHLYDQRGEIATNLARKQLAITADEAFQFAVVDYVGQHRGATLRPALVKRPTSAELRSRLPAEKLDKTFYVKVGKDGKPIGSYADAACVEQLSDPALESIIQTLRFNPALEKGKPVEGAVPVHLDLPTT